LYNVLLSKQIFGSIKLALLKFGALGGCLYRLYARSRPWATGTCLIA